MLRTVAGYQFFPLRVGIPRRFRHAQTPRSVETPADLISSIIGNTLAANSTLADLFAEIIAATAFSGFGLPNFLPEARTAASPNRVRSLINSLSRCATSANTPTVKRSAVGQSQATKSAPLFWSLKRNSAFRANRSSFAMTSVALCFLT